MNWLVIVDRRDEMRRSLALPLGRTWGRERHCHAVLGYTRPDCWSCPCRHGPRPPLARHPQVKLIDFGAAVDMCTGINFNPLYGMLDPRYSPPEELVMPPSECAVPYTAPSAVRCTEQRLGELPGQQLLQQQGFQHGARRGGQKKQRLALSRWESTAVMEPGTPPHQPYLAVSVCLACVQTASPRSRPNAPDTVSDSESATCPTTPRHSYAPSSMPFHPSRLVSTLSPSTDFPKAPAPFFAAVLSPFAWAYGRPDLFDSYTMGVLLVQMAVPELRSQAQIRLFNTELRQYDNDLERWRLYRVRGGWCGNGGSEGGNEGVEVRGAPMGVAAGNMRSSSRVRLGTRPGCARPGAD